MIISERLKSNLLCKNANLILFALLFFISNQTINSQSKTSGLPVIDLTHDYPKKDMYLEDIADTEYIPLETTDDILLSGEAKLSYVSDKYILVYEPNRGDIYVFNRTGKLHSHFNNKGQSGREYSNIGYGGAIFDEKNAEIYVCSHKIQVYSPNGEYKRTLNINALWNERNVFNFDNEMLLVYDGLIIESGKEKNKNEKPYYLISKKDGSTTYVFDIHLPKRYSTYIIEHVGHNTSNVRSIAFSKSMHYGEDFVIADISSDTLYLLTSKKKLTPILVRMPSVHTSSNSRMIWTTLITTDKFILIGYFDINSKGGGIPNLIYEFETGEISNLQKFDTVFHSGVGGNRNTATAKNTFAELIEASEMIRVYKKKRLKESIVKKIKEDDNQIVRIIKFK